MRFATMPSGVATIVFVAMLVVAPACARAQNLLPNADFDTDLAGWDTTIGTSWTADDSDGSSSSGSLQIVVSELKSTAITTCVPVTAGEAYDFGADIKLDLQGNAEGRAGVVARWEEDAGCGQESQVFPANTFLTSAPDWTTQHITATAPDGAVAALVELRATKTGGSDGSTVTASLDDALFQPTLSPGCADPVSPFNKITAGDALFVLKAAVGTATCDPCQCDVNGSGGVTSSDALLTLKAAVSIQVTLNCPAC